MLKIKKYNLPAQPERTVVRIPLGGNSITTMQALLKEIKKQEVPSTARMRLVTSKTMLGTSREARFEWPTKIAA